VFCTTTEQLECVLTRAGTTPLTLEVSSPLENGMLELIARRNHPIHSLMVFNPAETSNIESLSKSNMRSLKHLVIRERYHDPAGFTRDILDIAMLSDEDDLHLDIALGHEDIELLDHPIFRRATELCIEDCK
jgi:hypothetical protein